MHLEISNFQISCCGCSKGAPPSVASRGKHVVCAHEEAASRERGGAPP